MDTIKEMNKFVFAMNTAMSDVVIDAAESMARLVQRNVLALPSKSQGKFGVRKEIAAQVIVDTQEMKNYGITRVRVAIDYGFGGLQGLAHLLEYGFRLTAAYYGRQRKVPLTIAPRPFMRPAFLATEQAWIGRITKAIQSEIARVQ